MKRHSLTSDGLSFQFLLCKATIDDPSKDKLQLFLKNRNLTLTSVYNGRTIESVYQVNGAPALFIIDKKGTIIFTIEGYSDTLVKTFIK